MLPGGLIVSYSIIALSVLCSAPAVRKWLARLNERFGNDRYNPSVILINFILFAVCVVVSCLPYVAGRLTGQGFAYLDEAYRGAQALIATAQNEQNLAILSSIQTYIDLFGKVFSTRIWRLCCGSDFSILVVSRQS